MCSLKLATHFFVSNRWGFVTHGGIDGFSRMTTFLKCSTDNEPVTVLDSFIDAVNHYGLPEKARSDRGNVCYAHHCNYVPVTALTNANGVTNL